MKYTLNAKGKKIGRVATEAAHLLMGKARSDFARNRLADVRVEIVNAASLSIPPRKLRSKEYVRYTGYPGGLRKEMLEKTIAKGGYKAPLEKAVFGMLPANKLRKERMKRLKISE